MKRTRGILFLAAIMVAVIAMASPSFASPTKSKHPMATAQKAVDVNQCAECHDVVVDMHKNNQHAKVNCISCHDNLEVHNAAETQDESNRPKTLLGWDGCGACHVAQAESIAQIDYHRPARVDKSMPSSRIPIWYDKLMGGHGFTIEHNITRSHALMMVDQYVADRAFGGRFQPIDGWYYLQQGGEDVWAVLEDIGEKNNDPVLTQKKFLPETAMAANPVCINCKTMDHILDWAYLGEPGQGAKWDRTSNVVAFAKDTNHALNCNFCHDPHSAEPRVVRDALIEALENPQYGPTVYSKDPNKTKYNIIELGERDFTRKIAILEKSDSRLMCAQCHVEYNCNAGTNPSTGESYGFASPLTNHYPLKDALNLYEHYYEILKFADFKHNRTGSLLWKGQHPEFETYYESVHSKEGIGCADCHTPVMNKGKKTQYTSHFATSPRFVLKDTCLTSGCHTEWTEADAIYSIDSIKAYTKGRMRKAEYYLVELIDTIQLAQALGVDAKAIKVAQTEHSKAHILWEYWTAENSDGFHNPELARQSITLSTQTSKAATVALKAAIAENSKLLAKK